LLGYGAGRLSADLSPDGVIEKIVGEPDASLVSTTPSARTAISTTRIDLEFSSLEGESVLKRAVAHGRGVVESKSAGQNSSGDTRILRSEVIETVMRPGGEEIERIETHAPGRIELIPGAPGGRRRTLDGERIAMAYASGNQLESLQAVNAATRTEPPAQSKEKQAAARTWSKGLRASFDAKTGQMKRIEQWEDFRYEEGVRQARASHATFEPDFNRMTLQKEARVWDPSGSTSADIIRMEQATGRFTAEGKVSSTHMPDDPDGRPSKDQNRDSGLNGMLAGNQPVQAVAERMTSEAGHTRIRYLGNAVLWQKGNRVQADDILIDRTRRRLVAGGNVFTEFVDQESGNPDGAPQFTRVRAAHLVYTDPGRLAHYTGGAVLTRPNLKVTGQELRAWLAEPDEVSRIERLQADGRARIEQVLPDRTRTGTAEHAEYLALEEKLILRGGDPQFVDSLRGSTRGAELTYFLNDDRLLVSGQARQPASSRILRR
jgi:lipopolysaccharide export system protein LptA